MNMYQSKRIRIEPLKDVHAESLRRILSPLAIKKFTVTIPHPYSEQNARDWIRSVNSEESRIRSWIVVLDEKMAGFVDFIYGENGKCEIGFVVGTEYQGKGIASFALQASMLSEKFFARELSVESKFVAYCHEDNKASERVLEKNGFLKAGSKDIEGKAFNVFHYE